MRSLVVGRTFLARHQNADRRQALRVRSERKGERPCQRSAHQAQRRSPASPHRVFAHSLISHFLLFFSRLFFRVYSMTSSASAISLSGMARPSAFAAFMLMMVSKIAACTTGRSAGFSPLRMRATVPPPCSHSRTWFGP